MTDITDDVIDQIDAYFRSGNSVPVTRATIKFEEWQAAKALLQRQRERKAVAVPKGQIIAYFDFDPEYGHPFIVEANEYIANTAKYKERGWTKMRPLYAAPPADTVKPIPVNIKCPECGTEHIDKEEWATRPHKTHQCQQCKHEWRPFEYATVGIADTVKQDDAMRKAGEELLAAYTEPFPMGTEGQEAQDAWGLRQKNAVEAMRQALANNGDCPHPIEEELTK
jgi:endogenous inhibitor of DNA gyrase (YacG/DUF329 family)